MSELFKKMCILLNVKQSRTTPYHPTGDELVEFFNRTLQQMLVSFFKDTSKNWDDHLPFVLTAYMSAVHESTGCSTNLMVFGCESPGTIDLIRGRVRGSYDHEVIPNCSVEHVAWLEHSCVELLYLQTKR